MKSTAWISADGKFRYHLTRQWEDAVTPRWVGVVMLNPSIADAEVDDPTIRRCVSFGKALGEQFLPGGATGIAVANLYAHRATDPEELQVVEDPEGPDNRKALEWLAEECSVILLAWGGYPYSLDSAHAESVVRLLRSKGRQLVQLKKSGQPRKEYPHIRCTIRKILNSFCLRAGGCRLFSRGY